jgi:hypothetical protein
MFDPATPACSGHALHRGEGVHGPRDYKKAIVDAKRSSHRNLTAPLAVINTPYYSASARRSARSADLLRPQDEALIRSIYC